MTTPTAAQIGTWGANVYGVRDTLSFGETKDDFIIMQDFSLPRNFRADQVPVHGDAFPGGDGAASECAPWDHTVVDVGSFVTGRRPDQSAFITGVKFAKPKRLDTGIEAMSGTSTGSNTTLTLKDTGGGFGTNTYVDYAVSITGGTGEGQWRPIVSSTDTALTVGKAWATTPDGTSTYKIWALTEVARMKETGRLARYLGTRVFLCPDTIVDVVAAAIFPELTAMDTDAWAAALLREKAIERNWRKGLARITCRYDSFSPDESYHSGSIAVDTAILECDADAILRPMLVDENTEDPQTVGVAYLDENLIKCWVPIIGEGMWPYVRALLRVRAVASTDKLATLAPLLGHVNDAACSNIIGAAENTLWFKNFQFRRRRRGASVVYECVLYLFYDPGGWDASIVVQQKKLVPVWMPLHEEDGATDTAIRVPTWTWVNTAEATKTLKPMVAASFAAINGLF